VAPPAPPARAEPPYEIVRGRKVELPPTSTLAALVAFLLQDVLGPYARMNALGRVLTEGIFIFDAAANTRRRPDVAFVSAARWPLNRSVPGECEWEVAPDLAVEVISPNNLFEAVHDKLVEYFRYGVQQVWHVPPRHGQVHVYDGPTSVRILTEADELAAGPLLPGLRFPLACIVPREEAPPPPTP
jgi:Uma2 family endonuclease